MDPEPNVLELLRGARTASRRMRRMAERNALTLSLVRFYLDRIDAAFDRTMGPEDGLAVEPFTVIEGGRR